MPTVYHRDQTGAPALVYTTTASAVGNFTALKEVLKACLINGYAGRPAAGWALINEGSDFIVLRNGSQSGYVCLSWASSLVTVWLAETYTGMSGNVMTGSGRRSGVAASSGAPQKTGTYGWAYASTSTSWYVIADERTFLLGAIFAPALSAAEPSASNVGSTCLYVGEDSEGNFIAVGGLNTTTTSVGTPGAPITGFDGEAFTPLRNPATGLLVDTGSLVVEVLGLTRNGLSLAAQTSTSVIPAVSLSPVIWRGGGVYAGRLRGVAVAPPLVLTTNASHAAQSLGIAAGITTRTANTLIPLGDPYTYFVRTAQYLTSFFLVTDNAELW